MLPFPDFLSIVLTLCQLVAPQSSVIYAPNEITDTINADHLNMVRFAGNEDDGYEKSLSAIRLVLHQIQHSGTSSHPGQRGVTGAGRVQSRAFNERSRVCELSFSGSLEAK